MCEDRRVRHCLANIIFDTFKKLMPAMDRPITWNEDVYRYEFSRSGLTSPQCVKFYTRLFVALENLLDGNAVFSGQRCIHQSTDGSSNNSDTSPDDVGGHYECHNRIESRPTCQGYHNHTNDHSDRCPYVCEQMTGICFERYRVALCARRATAEARRPSSPMKRLWKPRGRCQFPRAVLD